MARPTMSDEEFDAAFDAGEDIDDMIDWSCSRLVTSEAKRVNVDFPDWMAKAQDRESGRLGVIRQSLIKMWLAGKLEGVT